MNRIDKKQIAKMLFWTTVSAAIQAFSLTSFSVPAKIYPSGVTGLSRLFSDVLADFFGLDLPFFYLYLIINVILAAIVYRTIGRLFTIFSLYQAVMVSLMSSLYPAYHVLDEKILIAVFGGIINGLGVSLALMHGASSGGTDFLSVLFSHKYHRSMWDQIFAFNCVLIIVAGILYGWENAAYSIIFQYASNTVISRMHKRYTHQAIIIVTRKPDQVIDTILSNVRHGITRISAKGAYHNADETMLYTVVNTFETGEVVRLALKGDPDAFIETRDSEQIFGNYYQKPLD